MVDEYNKCPDCGTLLDFHHEKYETVVYSCPLCKHLIAARKNNPPYEYVFGDELLVDGERVLIIRRRD